MEIKEKSILFDYISDEESAHNITNNMKENKKKAFIVQSESKFLDFIINKYYPGLPKELSNIVKKYSTYIYNNINFSGKNMSNYVFKDIHFI